MKIFLIATVCLPLLSISQKKYQAFSWDDENIEFKTVKLSIKNDANKTIFEGLKDSYIKISTIVKDRPEFATISVKLSGFFQIENGTVSSFSYNYKDGRDEIIYSIIDGTKLCSVLISYFTQSDDPDFIVVVATENYLAKPLKKLSYTLRGFE